MNAEFEQRQHEIDRQLAALAEHLRAPALHPDSVAGVKTAVREEARRLQRRDRRLVMLRPLVGAAAAVLLVVGLSLPGSSEPVGQISAFGDDPAAVFSDWVDALEESGEQFARLLGDDWLFEGLESGSERNGEVSDPLDSLEESLESFEQMIEA
jgi:hypothetical protein